MTSALPLVGASPLAGVDVLANLLDAQRKIREHVYPREGARSYRQGSDADASEEAAMKSNRKKTLADAVILSGMAINLVVVVLILYFYVI